MEEKNESKQEHKRKYTTISSIDKAIEMKNQKIFIARDKRYKISMEIKEHEDEKNALIAEKYKLIAERLNSMNDEKKNKYLAMMYEEEKQEQEAKRKEREEKKLLREAKKKERESKLQQTR